MFLWVFLLTVAAGALTLYARSRSHGPLPPGPKGRYPLVGMTFDMDSMWPWRQLTKWFKIYGPIIHTRIGLQHFVFISSGDIAREFLDKRASIYSSRPPSQAGLILSGNDRGEVMRSVLMPYGPRWRRVQKIFKNVLTVRKCDSYLPVQQSESIAALKTIRDNPEVFAAEILRYALSVARSVAYGKRVQNSDDKYAVEVKRIMDQASTAMTPGRYIVDAIPTLGKLPRAFKPWLQELEKFREDEQTFGLIHFREALEEAEKNPDLPCIALDIKREMEASGGFDEPQAATTAGEIPGAGSDTTANSLLFMILACLTHPEVVKKAHEELDRVIGHDRFPTWADEPNLPYIRAIIKEQQRWRTIAPMSFAHYAEQEDVYNGYRIPKGSIVSIVTWAIHMDPERYPNPEQFAPERFLDFSLSASAYATAGNPDGRDHFSYGGGRRLCPGMHLAERSLFTMTARLLHTFDLKLALDAAGKEIPVDPDNYRSSLIMAPEPFPARFLVRNEKVGKLLDKEWDGIFGNGPIESWSKASV